MSRVTFYSIGRSISEIVVVGQIELVDGEMRYSGMAAQIKDILVVEPGNPSHVLTPDDGEAWLRALPYEFRSPYLMAEFLS